MTQHWIDFLCGLGIGLFLAGHLFNVWMVERLAAKRWKRAYEQASEAWMQCNAEWLALSLRMARRDAVADPPDEPRAQTRH